MSYETEPLWIVRVMKNERGYTWIESRGVFADSFDAAYRAICYLPGFNGRPNILSCVMCHRPTQIVVDGDQIADSALASAKSDGVLNP